MPELTCQHLLSILFEVNPPALLPKVIFSPSFVPPLTLIPASIIATTSCHCPRWSVFHPDFEFMEGQHLFSITDPQHLVVLARNKYSNVIVCLSVCVQPLVRPIQCYPQPKTSSPRGRLGTLARGPREWRQAKRVMGTSKQLLLGL